MQRAMNITDKETVNWLNMTEAGYYVWAFKKKSLTHRLENIGLSRQERFCVFTLWEPLNTVKSITSIKILKILHHCGQDAFIPEEHDGRFASLGQSCLEAQMRCSYLRNQADFW